MNNYMLLKTYESPTGRIISGVIKTAREWLDVFPKMNERDFDIKTDWFVIEEPKKERIEVLKISSTHLDDYDGKEAWIKATLSKHPDANKLKSIRKAIESILNDDAEAYWKLFDRVMGEDKQVCIRCAGCGDKPNVAGCKNEFCKAFAKQYKNYYN